MKRKNRFSVILALSVFIRCLCSAETVTLDSLIQKAYSGNPEINAARKKAAAAYEVSGQEMTPDNPQLFLDYQKIPAGDISPGAAEDKMFGITQMLPWPGKLGLGGRIADRDAEIAALEVKNTELGVISDLKAAYAEYFYISKAIEVYSENAEIMRNISTSLESRYAAGKAAQSEVLKAQVEAAKMSNMVFTSKQELESSRAEINMLTGGSPDSPLGEPEAPAPAYLDKGWAEVKDIVLNNNYEIRERKIGVSRSGLEKDYGVDGFFPDIELTYRKRRTNGAWDGNDIMVGATAPLWFWKPALRVKQMSYELERAEYESKDAEIRAVYDARVYFSRLETGRGLIDLYRTSVLPQAEQARKASEAEYFSGRGDFLQFLDSTRTMLDFKLDYYKNISDYLRDLAALEKIAGTEFKQGGNK